MIRQYRKQWLRWHNNYERTARIIFQRTFKEIAKDIPFERMSAGTYKAYLQTHVSKEKIFEAYVKVYSEIGIKHGKRVGVQINKQINEKNFTIDGFLNEFQRTLINFLATNEGSRITTVRQSYIQYLTQIMTKGIEEGKTMSMISTDMTKLVKSRNFYRWQALRIARTETTAASNYAATVSSSVSGVLMDKVWVSALDARTRREPESHFDHYHMNQVKVPLDKPFEVSGEKLMFPGDPKGSAGNVINCRCSVAQVVRRDANGNIMRVSDVPKIPNTVLNTTIRNNDLGNNKFTPAKTIEEAENRMLKFAPKVDFKGLKLSEQNEILQGVEEVLGKYNVKLSQYLGFQVKRRRSFGVAARDFDNNPLYIRIQKTFSKNSLKEQRLTNVNFNESRNERIRRFEQILAEGTRPQQLLDKTRLNLEALKNTKRWGVYQDGTKPLYKVVVHESFHTVDYKYGLRNIFEKELKKQNINRNDWYKVSEYGGSTIGELWAETATAIHTNTKIPNEFVRAFNETIKTIPGL